MKTERQIKYVSRKVGIVEIQL